MGWLPPLRLRRNAPALPFALPEDRRQPPQAGARNSLNHAPNDRTVKLGHAKGMRPRPKLRARRARFGLRARVAFSWALAAGVLSASVGGLSYTLVRRFLVLQRDELTSRQAFSNARVVKDTLRSPPASLNITRLLESLRTEGRSFPLVKRDDQWYGTAGGRGPGLLPISIQAALDSGISGRQRFHDGDTPYLAVGINIPSIQTQYVEVFPQDNLQRILDYLRSALVIAAIAGVGFGGLFGWWSARRVLLPVRRVAEAAEALAGGALETRLAAERDNDLNRLVTSFNSMTDAVQQRIEREARFASDVSHELRTPLGALSAAAEVLDRRRADLPERAGQAVDVITSQLRRLSSMVLDLLEIARIDAGVADLHLQDTEMAGLVRYIAQSNNVSTDVLRIDRSQGTTRTSIDRRRFEQILRNLIDNATKYGLGVERITVQGTDLNVLVHVDDRGAGVPIHERTHIFERFARGTETQDVSGTGLGLALAADQASLMGARIQVGDAPLHGARFSVILPRNVHEESE